MTAYGILAKLKTQSTPEVALDYLVDRHFDGHFESNGHKHSVIRFIKLKALSHWLHFSNPDTLSTTVYGLTETLV